MAQVLRAILDTGVIGVYYIGVDFEFCESAMRVFEVLWGWDWCMVDGGVSRGRLDVGVFVDQCLKCRVPIWFIVYWENFRRKK